MKVQRIWPSAKKTKNVPVVEGQLRQIGVVYQFESDGLRRRKKRLLFFSFPSRMEITAGLLPDGTQ
jgi:hypothetical protein